MEKLKLLIPVLEAIGGLLPLIACVGFAYTGAFVESILCYIAYKVSSWNTSS